MFLFQEDRFSQGGSVTFGLGSNAFDALNRNDTPFPLSPRVATISRRRNHRFKGFRYSLFQQCFPSRRLSTTLLRNNLHFLRPFRRRYVITLVNFQGAIHGPRMGSRQLLRPIYLTSHMFRDVIMLHPLQTLRPVSSVKSLRHYVFGIRLLSSFFRCRPISPGLYTFIIVLVVRRHSSSCWFCRSGRARAIPFLDKAGGMIYEGGTRARGRPVKHSINYLYIFCASYQLFRVHSLRVDQQDRRPLAIHPSFFQR